MKNKLNKWDLLELYKTFDVENMKYALSVMRGLRLKQWFKNVYRTVGIYTIGFLIDNSKYMDMFNVERFSISEVEYFISKIDDGISFFTESDLNKLKSTNIYNILLLKPELITNLNFKKLTESHLNKLLVTRPELKEYLINEN